MLHRIALMAIAAPRRIIAVAVLVLVAAAIFGIPVAKSLSAGGFQDPTSESAAGHQLLADKFGQGDQQMLIHRDRARRRQQRTRPARWAPTIVDAAQRLAAGPQRDLGVDRRRRRPPSDLVSKDGKSGLIVVDLTGGENDAQKNAQDPRRTTSSTIADGVTVRRRRPGDGVLARSTSQNRATTCC